MDVSRGVEEARHLPPPNLKKQGNMPKLKLFKKYFSVPKAFYNLWLKHEFVSKFSGCPHLGIFLAVSMILTPC
jgi:hypothetical protein